MKKIFTSILFLLGGLVSTYAQHGTPISIQEARQKGVGQKVTVKGIVTNGAELGIIRYFQDDDYGLSAYGTKVNGVALGDSILVTGELKLFNQLLEIDPIDEITVINSNNPLPAPIAVSLSEGYTNRYESMLMRFAHVSTSASGNFANNTNYNINRDGVSRQIRASGGTANTLVGSPIPAGTFTVTGVMSRFNATYQLLPRSAHDIQLGAGPVISEELYQTQINQNSLELNFSTLKPGSTILEWGTTPALGSKLEINEMVTTHKALIEGLEPGVIYYVKASSKDAANQESTSGLRLFATASRSTGEIKVYFTNSVNTSFAISKEAKHLPQAVDDTLIDYISRATHSIDAALYNINNDGLSNITAALNAAHSRGVQVRIVANGNTAQLGLKNQGLHTGIPVIYSPQGSAYSLMHNKFFVFDCEDANPNKPWVWTGSTNLTAGQINTDANNVIAIQDQALARAYTLEFNEMFGSTTSTPNATLARYGAFKTDNTPHHFKIGGTYVESYFSPSDDTESKIVAALQSADREINVATMLVTREPYAKAILDRKNNNQVWTGVLLNEKSTPTTYFDMLQSNLSSQGLFFQHNQAGTLHHKYAIVDHNAQASDPQVITGSHNWSSSANTRNDENTLIIHSETVANQYFQEWVKRFQDNGGTYVITSAPGKAVARTVIYGLYPNPASTILNLQIESTTQSQTQVAVCDVMGRVVWTWAGPLQGIDVGTIQIPVETLKNGVYLVQTTVGGVRNTQKFIVSH